MSVTLFDRAKRLLNLKDFAEFLPPVKCGTMPDWALPKTDRQYILRMLVRRPGDTNLTLPPELEWIQFCAEHCGSIQAHNGLDPVKDFTYVTVRHGLVTTETDDLWHVDGFSMRMPHRPEQNYVYSDRDGTEVLHQGFKIPDTFDPKRHNIHQYFQDYADESKIKAMNPGTLYCIDPYIVHRRPTLTSGKMRTFFRISFIPIEVEDDTCTPNPLFPHKVYNRNAVEEVRKKLLRWTK
jgi:hypothetical protein